MALDIHTKEGDHWIYGIDSGEYGHLYELFTLFYLQSGIMFDEYCDPSPLTVGHQKLMLKLIDKDIEQTDLNKDKAKTVTILKFKALLEYGIKHNIELCFVGD